jgi:hypothetical protein
MNRILALLLAVLPAIAPAEAPPALPSPLYFDVLYKDKPAGFLKVEAARVSGQLVVRQTEELKLSKFLIKAKMDQSIEARWSDQRLDALTAHTAAETSIGDKAADLVVAHAASGLQATAEGKSHALAADAWPLMVWDKAFLSHPVLFELTKAEAVTLKATPVGSELVEADGGTLQCDRIDVVAEAGDAKARISLWYEPSGRLCAMLREGDPGPVRYVRRKS